MTARRDEEARQATLRRLAEKHEYHSAAYQLLVEHGFYDYAQIAHANELRLVRAWRDEMDDRHPVGMEVHRAPQA